LPAYSSCPGPFLLVGESTSIHVTSRRWAISRISTLMCGIGSGRRASRISGATATAYGNSCGGLTANSSLPTIGSTAPVALAGIAPSTLLAVALLGLPMSPGLPLDFVGMPGCRLLVITIDAMPVPISGAAATLSLAIPSDPTLAGVELGAQFVTVDPTANALGMHASNGVRLRLDR